MGQWCSSGANEESVVVKTKWGEVEGRRKLRKGGVALFYGVPYAAPPVGPLRFQKPREPSPWSGRRRCLRPAPIALQSHSTIIRVFLPPFLSRLVGGLLWCTGFEPTANIDWRRPQPLRGGCSEDCLYLNVETPAVPPATTPPNTGGGGRGGGHHGEDGGGNEDGGQRQQEKLHPVLVWIHGGSFQVGSGSLPAYQDPEHRLSAKEGLVVVNIQYRLGLWGFLKVEGGEYNLGLWDQRMALTWVRDNIAAFGGDPANVTIMGQSAGGISVGCHLISPQSQGLFHKAILLSGSLQPAVSIDEHHRVLVKHLTNILQPTQQQQQSNGFTLSASSLSGLSAAQLLAAQCMLIRACGQRVCMEAGPLLFQPVADGDFLPAQAINKYHCLLLLAAANGQQQGQQVPVMLGYTRDEDLLFHILTPAHFDCQRSEQRFADRVAEMLWEGGDENDSSREAARQVEEEMKRWMAKAKAQQGGLKGGEDEWTWAYITTSGLFRFILPAHITAQTLAEKGNGNVYLYRCDVSSPLLPGVSAVHSIDLPYLWGTTKLLGLLLPRNHADNVRLHEVMSHAFATFASTGRPYLPLPRLPSTTAGGGNGRKQGVASTSTEPSSAPPPPSSWPALRTIPASGAAPNNTAAHPVMVFDLPVHERCRVEEVDMANDLLPAMWRAAAARTARPIFWLLRQDDDDNGQQQQRQGDDQEQQQQQQQQQSRSPVSAGHSL